MRKNSLILVAFFMTSLLLGQSRLKVGGNATSITSSAVLEVESTTKGFLPPRMTSTQMAAIVTPATGLMVYCTDCSPAGLRVYGGSAWTESGSGGGNTEVIANCNTNGFVGAYMNTIALDGTTFKAAITNNSLLSVGPLNFASGDLVLTGISGLSVGTPSPATVTSIAPGATQLISYPITGTPAATGTLTGTWSKLALTCSDTQVVAGLVAALNDTNYCTGSALNGVYVGGQALTSSNTYTVSIKNNSGGVINNLPAPSTGNLSVGFTGGGTLSVASVTPSTSFNLAIGETKTITYVLSGTPAGVGTLTTTWSYSDLSCQKTRTITTGDASLVLPQDKYVYSAIGGVQGLITNTSPNQLIINVPYTGGVGSYSAYSGSAVTGAAGEGGDVNGFSISYPAGTFSSSGTIPVTVVVAGDGSYSAKKMVLGSQESIVSIPLLLNGSSRGNIVLSTAGGIFDRMYGVADNTGSTTSHNFIYGSITGADGRVWLNNNLGAHYAQVGHPNFNPAQQATSATDYLAYGSKFQWGRKPDGHELVTYSGATTVSASSTASPSFADNPTHALFIINSTAFNNYDWRATGQDDTLWATAASANNPCPNGYRVPTTAEFTTLVTSSGITNNATAASSLLKLSAAGYRNYVNAIFDFSSTSNYWSSSFSAAARGGGLYFNSSVAGSDGSNSRAFGFSIRCIKD